MNSYIKKRLKVLVRISKPKIVRYESCLTLNQKVNNIRKSYLTDFNIRKSHYTQLQQNFALKQMSVFRVLAISFLKN